MNCPKCDGPMETVVFREIEIDRCSSCGGIWFDEFERLSLESLAGAEAIDIGDAGRGRELNEKDRYPCPRCGNPMIRMVDPKQPHIWFEQCGSCHGTFFDAGEFKDLREHTFADVLKRLFARERR